MIFFPDLLQRFERPLWVLALASATIGFFWLPWYFPSTTPAMGESYSVGFNNRLAILFLGLAIASATVAQLVSLQSSRAIEWLVRRPRLVPSWQSARKEYLILATCTVVWTQILWAWGTSLVDPAFGDSRGVIYGIDLLALGRVPYRDFIFNYGAAHIYLPYGLSWASGGDMSFERAYLTVLMLFVVIGFVSIFTFLRALQIRRDWRALALGLVLASWAQFQTSTAAVPARFLSVPAGILVLHAALQMKTTSVYKACSVAAAASCGMIFYCLALSPEMGIAACAAVCGYAFGAAVLQKRVALAASSLTGSVAAVAGTLFVFPEYFLTVVAFAGGFGNLPVYPNLSNLLLVAASMCVFPSLIASALRNPADPRAPLALGLAAGGGLLLVGCFGRADPWHVFANGMVPLLFMFAVAVRCGPLMQRLWPLAYVLVEIILLQISHWWCNYGTLNTAIQLRRFYDANPQVVAEWREQWDARRASHPLGSKLYWDSVLPYPRDLDQITARGVVIQTGASEWNLWLGRYLLLQRELPKDFYTPWLLTACGSEQIEQRLGDLRKAKYLLVPENDFAATEAAIDQKAYEQFLHRWLGGLLLYPVNSKVRIAPYLPDSIQIKAISDEYKPIGRFQFFMYMPFVLLERQGG
jgi:hypothetical protein